MKRTNRPNTAKKDRSDYPEVSFLKQHWPVMLFIVFVANFAVTRSLQLYFYAQSCMSVSQVQSDSRCLYIWSSNIYQMGTKSNPHMGNPCGSDVTSIIPNSHTSNMAKYLDPRLIGSVCTSQPTPTATPVVQPSNTPQPTSVPQPTATPKPNPTATPQPTSIPQPTATIIPGAPTYTPTPYRSPTPTQVHAVSNTPTRTPTQKPGLPIPTVTPKKKVSGNSIRIPSPTLFVQSEKSGFGKYITYTPDDQHATQAKPPLISLASIATNPQKLPWRPMVIGSQLLVVASFIIMVISFILGVFRKR